MPIIIKNYYFYPLSYVCYQVQLRENIMTSQRKLLKCWICTSKYLILSNLSNKRFFSQKGIRFPLNNSKLLLLFTFLSLLSETPSEKSNDQIVKNFKMLVLGPKMSHLPHFGQNKVFSPKRVSSLFSVNWHYIYMQLIIYIL